MRCLVFFLFAFSSLLHADTSSRERLPWRDGDAARKLLAPWLGCPEIVEMLDLEAEASVSARPLPTGVEAFAASEGSGRWGYGVYTRLRLEPGGCQARGSVREGGKELLDAGMRRVGLGGAAPPSLAELAAWDEEQLVGDPDGAELAAARLLVQLAQEDDAEPGEDGILAPAWPAQPEHPGRPRGSPAAIWSPAALAAAGVARPWLKNEAGEPFDAIEHGAVRAPRLLRSSGRWEIWELRFRARLGGGLLAVYDTRSDRHRWLWGTHFDDSSWEGRGPLDAGHFRILSLDGDRLLLRNLFEDREYVWSIDLRRGTARQLPRRRSTPSGGEIGR